MKSDKVVNILRKDSVEWIKALTDDELYAIAKYTKNIVDNNADDFFKRLNAMLRGEIPHNDRLDHYAKLISSGISKFELKHDIICYRTMKSNPFKSAKAGDIITLNQFVSTSVVKSKTLKGDFFMTIKVKANTNGAYIERLSSYPNQREFLLNMGLEYYVVSEDDNQMLLEVI